MKARYRGLLGRWRASLYRGVAGKALITAAGCGMLVLYLIGLWRGSSWGPLLFWLSSAFCIVAIMLSRQSQLAVLCKEAEGRVRSAHRRFSGRAAEGSSGKPSANDARTLIRGSLEPRLEVYKGLDAVCLAAAGAIEQAHRERDDDARFVIFYGSATLSTPEGSHGRHGARRVLVEDEDLQSPEHVYAGALEAAASDQIRMRRYICLLSTEEFRRRGQAVRREYLEWLRSQYHQLGRNPNYRLTSAVRAPAWNSNAARIITRRQVLEISGNGEAALAVFGVTEAEVVRRHARKTVLGDARNRNQAVHYGESPPWATLAGEWRPTARFFEEIVTPISDELRTLTRETTD